MRSHFFHFCRFTRLIFFIFGLILCGTITQASVLNEITEDFKPVSGYVVMASDSEYIIDVDETQGVAVGDLFSVLKAGKKIIHPKTQKVLGTLEEIKAVLKVVRLKSGYSFARPLDEKTQIKRGDMIRRYDNLSAIFWDYTGSGKSFFSELRKALPDLKWQEYEISQRSKPDQPTRTAPSSNSLIFILTEQGIDVRDSESAVIRSYAYPESISQTPERISALRRKPAPDEPVALKGAQKPVIHRPELEAVQTIGKISDYTVMADFVKHRNRLLMASTDGTDIGIFDITQKLSPIAEGDTPVPGQILALKWWQPEAAGPLYLAANTWSDQTFQGRVFVFAKGRLTVWKDRLKRILGTFDLDGDGRPETLLAQEFEREGFFGSSIKELKFVDGQLKSTRPSIPLPSRFVVLGSLFADLDADGQVESAFVRDNILYIYSGDTRLYKSSKQMGGTLSYLTYDTDTHRMNAWQNTSAFFEVSPAVSDLDGDGLPEILAVASERSGTGKLGISPGINKSWLAVFKFKDGRIVKSKLGGELETPVQGLAVYEGKVVFVTTSPKSFFEKDGNSYLLAYTLNR
ncbi:MAG: VCBS repeat-containing protein [Desulfobacterales bacterium]